MPYTAEQQAAIDAKAAAMRAERDADAALEAAFGGDDIIGGLVMRTSKGETLVLNPATETITLYDENGRWVDMDSNN